MAKHAAVTFFYQSSFSVAIEKTLLIFSYRQTGLEMLQETHYLTEKDFKGFNNIVVFVARGALEHNDPVIYTWKKSFPITYVVASDAKTTVPEGANARIVKPGDIISVANVQVGVYGSTDAGVSFLVKAAGLRIFHAGDLNLWHWREENSLHEITQAEDDYYRIVAQIPKEKMDICMFPVDPNLGGLYDAGANHFIMTLKPGVFFPMHWGKRSEIALDYARRMHTPSTQVYALTQPRETALIDFTTKPPMVRGAQVQRKLFGQGSAVDEHGVTLNAYISEDPFSETDLPVDLPISQDRGQV